MSASKAKIRPESPCSCTALRKATRRISLLYDEALAPSGLKTTQRAILAQIGRAEPTTVSALAEDLVMDAGALTHTLKPLERDGLVAIAIAPDDRRSRQISLTRRGRAKLEEMDALWASAEASFERALGAANRDQLRRLLKALISSEFSKSFQSKARHAAEFDGQPAKGGKASSKKV